MKTIALILALAGPLPDQPTDQPTDHPEDSDALTDEEIQCMLRVR